MLWERQDVEAAVATTIEHIVIFQWLTLVKFSEDFFAINAPMRINHDFTLVESLADHVEITHGAMPACIFSYVAEAARKGTVRTVSMRLGRAARDRTHG